MLWNAAKVSLEKATLEKVVVGEDDSILHMYVDCSGSIQDAQKSLDQATSINSKAGVDLVRKFGEAREISELFWESDEVKWPEEV